MFILIGCIISIKKILYVHVDVYVKEVLHNVSPGTAGHKAYDLPHLGVEVVGEDVLRSSRASL